MPAPATEPWFIPRLNPCAPDAATSVRIADFVNDPVREAPGDLGEDAADGDATPRDAVAVAQRDRARLDGPRPGDEHERHLVLLRAQDLLLHPVVAVVDLDPYADATQPLRDVV